MLLCEIWRGLVVDHLFWRLHLTKANLPLCLYCKLWSVLKDNHNWYTSWWIQTMSSLISHPARPGFMILTTTWVPQQRLADSEHSLLHWGLQVSGLRWNKWLGLNDPLSKRQWGQHRVKAGLKKGQRTVRDLLSPTWTPLPPCPSVKGNQMYQASKHL